MKQLPQGFVDMLTGLGLGDAVAALSDGEPEVSVRANRRKPALPASGPAVPWCPDGIYLAERPVFALDPCWHQGRYYVQEAGSMFVSYVVRALGLTVPVAALDACAAPGGKTTALIDALPDGSLVVANEYVPSRAAILKENIVKWGSPSTIVTRGDTAAFRQLGQVFDLILADVPCSGEGMMRKDDEAVGQWGTGLIAECAARQWEIVCNLWEALRPGGIMIYSTCTFNREEDELTVARIISELGGESVEIPVHPDWSITPAIDAPGMHAYRFIPGRTRGEGLFLSVIRKMGDSDVDAYREMPDVHRDIKKGKNKDKNRDKNAPRVPDTLSSWITVPSAYELYASADRVNAFPRQWMPLLQRLRCLTDVIHEGVQVATLKGRDYIPAHGLVMSPAVFNKAIFPSVDIDSDTALKYLRGESPVLPADVPKGIAVLTYQGEPLGLVKNLGNRSNSLYPQQWKLRMEFKG